MIIRSDRRYELSADPGQVWSVLEGVDQYPKWWPWLADFDGRELAAGQQWHCTIRPPVPWSIRATVVLDDVRSPASVLASIRGDVAGEARLDITPSMEGSTLRLQTELASSSPILRLASRLAPQLSRFGHQWVLDTGIRQFRDHLKP